VRFLLAFAFALMVACSSSKSGDAPASGSPAPPARTQTITIGRDLDPAALEAALRDRHDVVSLALAPDAPYRRFLEAVDVLSRLGLDAELDVGRGGPQPIARPTVAAGAIEDAAPILVLTVSTDAIFLGATEVARLADLRPGDDIPALAAAIANRPQRPTRIAFQADDGTPGAIVIRAIGTTRRAGVTDVSLVTAIKPPVRLPQKRPE
jgi:biopolymer transport protein ExbD